MRMSLAEFKERFPNHELVATNAIDSGVKPKKRRAGKESILEERLYQQLLAYKLTHGLSREYKFHPTRRWRFDFAWPKHKVALEVEGGVWSNGRHNRARGFIKDTEKYNTATKLGWKVLRFTSPDINNMQALNSLLQIFGHAPDI